MKALVFIAALCFGIAFTAAPLVVLAANTGDFNIARTAFLKASAGDSSSIDDAVEQFAALLKTEPSNPSIIAYHGAALTMRARDTWFPWRKMSYSEEGLAEIDRALAFIKPEHQTTLTGGVPTALQAKFVAASTFLAVPAFMNRHAQGEKLLNEVLAAPPFANAPSGFRKIVLATALQHLAVTHPSQVDAWKRELAVANAVTQTSARR